MRSTLEPGARVTTSAGAVPAALVTAVDRTL